MLYRIGDFSRIVNVSIRTLRYYDNIDLFKPQEIDLFTNYRYYSDNQVEDFNLICELKDLGFSLEKIKNSWNHFDNDIMLKKKQELINSRDCLEEKIKRIDELRSNISEGKFNKGYNTDKVKIKSIF